MNNKTAIEAVDYIINIASRRQLRTVLKIAVKHLTRCCDTSQLTDAITDMSASLIER